MPCHLHRPRLPDVGFFFRPSFRAPVPALGALTADFGAAQGKAKEISFAEMVSATGAFSRGQGAVWVSFRQEAAHERGTGSGCRLAGVALCVESVGTDAAP